MKIYFEKKKWQLRYQNSNENGGAKETMGGLYL